MFTMNVPKTFWSNTSQTTAYLLNMMPTKVLSFKSPLAVLSLRTPLFYLPPKTFGRICYVHIYKADRTKLDPKALKYVFLGYGAN